MNRFAAWPNGSRIAITPMFEVWPDGKGPPNLVQRTQVKPGVVDQQAITWPHYAGREGVWQVMAAVFDKLRAYFAQFSGVWFARHRELAQWALDDEFDEVTYAQRFFKTPPTAHS